MTNRKSHTPFRLVPKSTTLDDFERPIRTLLQKRCVFRSPPQKIWMKIDPYYHLRKCRPVTLVSGGISFMWIFAEHLWGRGVKRQWSCRQRQFSAFSLAIFSEALEMRPALLCSDMQSVVSFSVTPKRVTLTWMIMNGLFHVKFCFRVGLAGSARATFEKIARKLIKIDTYCQRRKCLTGTLVYGSIEFVRIFARVL